MGNRVPEFLPLRSSFASDLGFIVRSRSFDEMQPVSNSHLTFLQNSFSQTVRQPASVVQIQSVRSKVRYWIASLTCSGVMSVLSSKSAMVRETFRIRS